MREPGEIKAFFLWDTNCKIKLIELIAIRAITVSVVSTITMGRDGVTP